MEVTSVYGVRESGRGGGRLCVKRTKVKREEEE